ncbi:hypothetical protein ACX0HA_05315 [Flavobacterium hauense]
MKRLHLLASLISVFFMSCSGNSQQLTVLGTTDLKELSALEYLPQSKTLWGLEDSGNKNKIYKIGKDGKTLSSLTISNIANIDWEEMTSDAQGNLYIGDFGNNDNTRKDLAIYKIDRNQLLGKTAVTSAKIAFYYPEQTEFPPKKSKMMFDCEAFFEFKGNFYLFTKNRSAKFDGSFFVYKVPNTEGKHKAQFLGKLSTCNIYKKCAVTAAGISPDGKTAVLLTGDKVFVMTNFGTGDFAKSKMQMHELGFASQKEGVCFIDNNTLLIADEKDKQTGGRLYQFKLPGLKAK